MGKSKAQDNLEQRLRELYPDSYISSEDYIGDIIEERDYSIDEIRQELGHKPHKMFVDIVMRDSERTVAFEYHGEQHYSLVGNMTKTSADVLLNQQLDQEKSWILSRIGIPLVAIPFDMYIDERVIEELIDEAFEECSRHRSELSECSSCQRLFPHTEIPYGICSRCREQETVAETHDCTREESFHEYDGYHDDDEMTYEDQMKAEARRLRKQRYREYKNSPEYQKRKEEDKKKRKELYKKMKTEMKRQNKEEGF